MGLLARLCREQGKTVVMIGHDLNLAHGVSTHALLLMGDGRWHAGPVDDAMQAGAARRLSRPPDRRDRTRRPPHLHSPGGHA